VTDSDLRAHVVNIHRWYQESRGGRQRVYRVKWENDAGEEGAREYAGLDDALRFAERLLRQQEEDETHP
jgi:hypothetical protein